MNYNTKKNALYIRGVVIACNLQDDQGDILDKKDIKKIFTSYANRNDQDIMHNFTKTDGVSIISNEILKKSEIIGDKTVPEGSWCCDTIIFDPELKKLIKENRITGYSLGAVQQQKIIDKLKREEKSEQLYFKDLESMECLDPLFISLVDKASNGFTLEVYDYNTYLTKNGVENMKEENFVDKFINRLIKASKEEKRDNKESEEVVNEKKEIDNDEEKEEIKNEIKSLKTELGEIREKLSQFETLFDDEEITPELIKKACELAKKYEDEINKKDEIEDEDKPQLKKNTQKLNTTTNKIEKGNTFYTKTNRDPMSGCKIR